MYIETKNYIPFEDKVYPERTYIYLTIKKATSKEEIEYLEKNIENCKNEELSYENYKEFLLDTQNKKANKIDFYNYLYHCCDLGTGEVYYHYICNPQTITNKIRENEQKRFIGNEQLPFSNSFFFYKPIIRNYKKAIPLYIYDTITYENILIFRFYKYNPSYFKVGTTQGFYEVFRVCFKGSECWGENREETYNFNLEFLTQSKKLLKYGKYTNAKNTLNENIKTTFPIIYNIATIYDKSIYTFVDFCEKWHQLYKTNTIFKNTPKDIVLDLKREENTTKNISTPNKYFCKVKSTNSFVCFHIFINNLEIERIYFDKNKIYKFGYNFFENAWTSTKREKLYANCVIYENVVYAKTYKDEEMRNTILNRFIPQKYLFIKDKKDNVSKNTFAILYKKRFFVNDILMQYDSVLYEQIFKLGFYNFIPNYTTNNGIFYLYANEFSTKKKTLTIKEVKNMQLHELFNITSKQLKFMPRNVDVYQAQNIIRRMHSKKWQKDFVDGTIRMQIASLFISDTKINKIIKIMKNNDKNYISFFMALLKKENPERYIDMYYDYLKIRNMANNYGGFEYKEIISPSDIEFLHNRAYRDYLYQRQLDNNKKQKQRTTQKEKFISFVETEEYKQFLYETTKYQIIGAKEPNDLIMEGKELSHCVGGYVGRMASKKSFIYFIRMSDEVTKPFYTIEVKKQKIKNNEYSYYLNQCYGFGDTIEKTNDLKKFIQKWARLKNIKINCRL